MNWLSSFFLSFLNYLEPLYAFSYLWIQYVRVGVGTPYFLRVSLKQIPFFLLDSTSLTILSCSARGNFKYLVLPRYSSFSGSFKPPSFFMSFLFLYELSILFPETSPFSPELSSYSMAASRWYDDESLNLHFLRCVD